MYTDISSARASAYISKINTTNYAVSANIYAADAAIYKATAYQSYLSAQTDLSLALSYYTAFSTLDIQRASDLASTAYYADLSATAFKTRTTKAYTDASTNAIEIAVQLARTITDLSYARAYALDASNNALNAMNASTSSVAYSYYLDVSSAYQNIYSKYIDASSAKITATTYKTNISGNVIESSDTFTQALISSTNVTTAYSSLNDLCIADSGTDISFTLYAVLRSIQNEKNTAVTYKETETAFREKLTLFTSTSTSALADISTNVSNTYLYLIDVSGYKTAAYNSYAIKLSSDTAALALSAIRSSASAFVSIAYSADLSASFYKTIATNSYIDTSTNVTTLIGLSTRTATDVSDARQYVNDASLNALYADSVSTSASAYLYYLDVSSAYQNAYYKYADASSAYISSIIYYSNISANISAANSAFNSAILFCGNVNTAYSGLNSLYIANAASDISFELNSLLTTIQPQENTANTYKQTETTYRAGLATFTSQSTLAMSSILSDLSYTYIYANTASTYKTAAYNSYTSKLSLETAIAFASIASSADLSASFYKTIATTSYSDASTNLTAMNELSTRTATDVSNAQAFAADASSNAIYAANASTSAIAYNYYNIDVSSAYQNAYLQYVDASSAYGTAIIYDTYVSANITAAESAFASALLLYGNVINAYSGLNNLCIANAGTDISFELTSLLATIQTLQNTANLYKENETVYRAGLLSVTSQSSQTVSDISSDVYTTYLYASDASGSKTAAYNSYTSKLSAENDADALAAAALPDYSSPLRFSSILDQSYTPATLVQATSFTTLKKYMLKYTDNSYLTIDTSFNLVLTSSTEKYKDVLPKIFGVVSDPLFSLTSFRIDSDLDSLYSLDYSTASGILKFSNNWGQAAVDSTYGYLRFEYINNKLKVSGRQKISDLSYNHAIDASFASSSFSTSYVYYDSASQRFKLTASESSAASFTLYNSPIHLDMPTDFNPYTIPYVGNNRVSIKKYVTPPEQKMTIADMDVKIRGAGGVAPKYRGQVDVSGYYSNGKSDICGNEMLTTIFSTVGAGNIRYDRAVYETFRTAALSTILGCNSIANGTKGQNTVPYVYYTLEISGGIYHPFMVIASYSISDKPNRLVDVCRPPSDGTNYATDAVTRDVTLLNYLTKIPMRNYGQISTLTENLITKSLQSDYAADPNNTPPISIKTPYNYASVSAIGIAIDGVVIYPTSNNTLHPAQVQAEIANTGIHIGKGMGLHYHADGHSANSNNMNLYNSNDYIGRRHPPLIGFGLDGIALYGQYDVSYSSMHGYTTSLDQYGGHTHADGKYGYHYHAHTVHSSDLSGMGLVLKSGTVPDANETIATYDLHILMKGAWAGKINTIPFFWDGLEPSYTLGKNNSIFAGF